MVINNVASGKKEYTVCCVECDAVGPFAADTTVGLSKAKAAKLWNGRVANE